MEIPEGDGLTNVLTPTMQQLVNNALNVSEKHRFLGHGGFNLTGKNIRTLREGQWLDDAVINAYLSMIQTHSDRHGYPSVLFFDSFHYTFLEEDRPEFLLRSLTKTNKMGYDYLFFQFHLVNHWAFAYASTKTRRLYYLDSMYGYDKGMEVLGRLQKYIYQEESRLKGDHPLFPVTPFRLTVYPNSPQQTNGVDCGVFLLANADHISRRAPTLFSQHDIPNIRRCIVWELVTRRMIKNICNTFRINPPTIHPLRKKDRDLHQ